MIRIQIIGWLILVSVFFGIQIHQIYRADQERAGRIAIDLRESLMTGQSVRVILRCKQILQEDRVVGISIDFSGDSICHEKQDGVFISHASTEELYFSESANSVNEVPAGKITVEYSLTAFLFEALLMLLVIMISVFLSMRYIRSLLRNVDNGIVMPIYRLSNFLSKSEKIELINIQEEGYETDAAEYVDLVKSFNIMVERSQKVFELERDIEQKQIEVRLSNQVAHDIRSPLSALNAAVYSLSEVSEEKRDIIRSAIQRISGIANDLLKKGREQRLISSLDGGSFSRSSSQLAGAIGSLKVTDINAVAAAIVSEKRVEYCDAVQIKFVQNDSEPVWALVNDVDLGRIVSNLINNSVEAMKGKKGTIEVAVSFKNGVPNILVKDNGCGMSIDVLEKVGTEGYTSGKGIDSGNGLGLFNAIQVINGWKGKLDIQSSLGFGTQISISLPSVSV